MAKKLLEIVSIEPTKAIYREYEEKPLKEDEIRATVEFAAAKHGSEFAGFRGDGVLEHHSYDGEKSLFVPRKSEYKFYAEVGNMWVGRVTEVGLAVGHIKPGMRVAAHGNFRVTHTRKAANVLILPDEMCWKTAVCYDPLQFALGGVRDGNVRVGDSVAVVGLGAIGQMAVQLARKSGAAKVIVCDPIEYRRKVALANGADHAIDSGREDAGYIIKELTGGRGADVVVEASGYYAGLQSAIRGAALNANVAAVGWYHGDKAPFDLSWEAHFNQPNLIFSRACSEPSRDYPRWDFGRICETCWEMLLNGWIKCENIVDPVVPFEDAAQAYMEIFADPSASVKLGVSYT